MGAGVSPTGGVGPFEISNFEGKVVIRVFFLFFLAVVSGRCFPGPAGSIFCYSWRGFPEGVF